MESDKKTRIYRSFMLIIITALITFLLTSVFMSNYYVKTKNGIERLLQTSEAKEVDTRIEIIKKYLSEYYLGDKPKEEELIEYAIKGYIAGLGDPYTQYLTKSEYEDLMVEVNGNYVGIGIYMAENKDGNVIILLPIEDSPAEKEGLKTGDIITKIDGEECIGQELEIIAKKIKGEEGSKVELEIIRGEEIINKTITRQRIQINHIKSKVLDNKIGYIQILTFDDGCSQEFETKLNELIETGINSLIIDIRDNGGGIVREAINIAELFVPKGNIIMRETDKAGNEEVTESSKDPKINSNMNVVVLTNENTASASEILVGALRDNNIVKVIGTNTFGKGVVQGIIPVASGGALKLTIKKIHTPNNNEIHKCGIKPDIEVKENEDTKEDEQLQKAIETLKEI